MKADELLTGLLALFRERIPEADFLRAYAGETGSRRLERPVVAGGVESETVKPGSQEVRYQFRIFLPEGRGAGQAEALFARMCVLAGEKYPGFSAISRGAAARDRATGLLAVDCALSFLDQSGGGGGGEALGRKIALGGREYTVSGVKVSVSRRGEDLVSVGETVPFAVLGEETEYTVELAGLEVSGLENLTGFTAELGTSGTYLGCRWKSLSDALGKGVFLSRQRQEG